jgi:hypothetical protein
MKHARKFKSLPWILLTVFVAVSIALTVSLIEERSGDKLRLTVHRDDMLSSVQAIQGACRCLVSAMPLGAEEDEAEYWLLTFNNSVTNT